MLQTVSSFLTLSISDLDILKLCKFSPKPAHATVDASIADSAISCIPITQHTRFFFLLDVLFIIIVKNVCAFFFFFYGIHICIVYLVVSEQLTKIKKNLAYIAKQVPFFILISTSQESTLPNKICKLLNFRWNLFLSHKASSEILRSFWHRK